MVRKFPIEGRAALWKEEVYFEIPIKMGEEKAKPTVETGTVAFWPMGGALCVFYGKSQPYSPVSILGKITKIWIFSSRLKAEHPLKLNCYPLKRQTSFPSTFGEPFTFFFNVFVATFFFERLQKLNAFSN